MHTGPDQRYDFFLSRRGSVAAVAREVADVLTEKGYKVLVQDYDVPFETSLLANVQNAVKNSRDLVILFTRDYEKSPLTRREFASFEAERALSDDDRRIIVLRCEDAPLQGLLARTIYQDLFDVSDPKERKRRIIAAVEQSASIGTPAPHATSSKQVFVSFSTHDQSEALSIVDALEQANIKCWISCRDIPYGEDFQDAIVEALDQSSGDGSYILQKRRQLERNKERACTCKREWTVRVTSSHRQCRADARLQVSDRHPSME
jgi:TIR domain